MNELNDAQVRDQMGVYVNIAMITYDMFIERLSIYSEISFSEKYLIAGQLTHALTLKACVNENSEDINYNIERIADSIELQSSTPNS